MKKYKIYSCILVKDLRMGFVFVRARKSVYMLKVSLVTRYTATQKSNVGCNKVLKIDP